MPTYNKNNNKLSFWMQMQFLESKMGKCNLINLMQIDANKTYKIYKCILISHKNHCKTQIIQDSCQ